MLGGLFGFACMKIALIVGGPHGLALAHSQLVHPVPALCPDPAETDGRKMCVDPRHSCPATGIGGQGPQI